MVTILGRRPRPGSVLLFVVLAAAAVGMAWDLDAVGWGNQYYAAVAQSGAVSEWGFFQASPDLAAVTGTDKPPLAFWPMAIAVWVFGLHGWAIALPQLVETMATVGLLAMVVRRVAGPAGAVVSAAVLASTPIVFVLARFDDPDTLLTLCVTAAAYAAIRACERPASRGWLILLGAMLGSAFLTKWLSAAIPAPALVGAVLWSGRGPAAGLRHRRIGRSELSAVGWVLGPAALVGLPWVLARWLVPAAHRPQLDSPSNSVLDLISGQNGVGRLAAAPHDAASVAIQGVAGPWRLVTPPFDGQIGWFLPVALVIVAVAAIRVRRGAKATPGWLVLGGWLGLTAVVFSFMGGYMHPYYTTLLAPALAAVVGLGADWAWRRRSTIIGRTRRSIGLAAMTALISLYAAHLLAAYPTLAWVRWSVLVSGVVAVVCAMTLGQAPVRARATLLRLFVAAAVLTSLGGPTAYAVSTFGHQVAGANPIAGPVSGSRPQEAYPGGLVAYLSARRPPHGWLAAAVTSTAASQLQLQSGQAVLPLGGFTGHAAGPGVVDIRRWVTDGRLRYLVLTGPYYRGLQSPPDLRGTALAAVMRWAAGHGCPAPVPDRRYIVLDLTCHA